MKTNKITLTITVEVLSIDSAPAIILQAVEQIQHEFPNGTLSADDGDTITWSIKQKEIVI